jgi:hypothetical protein
MYNVRKHIVCMIYENIIITHLNIYLFKNNIIHYVGGIEIIRKERIKKKVQVIYVLKLRTVYYHIFVYYIIYVRTFTLYTVDQSISFSDVVADLLE